MKLHRLLIAIPILLLISFLSCSDHSEDEFFENCSTEVCGEWKWVESHGSILGITITPETEGITKTLKINDTSYNEFNDDELIFESEYQIVDNFMEFEAGWKMYMEIVEDRLEMRNPFEDGFTHHYVKR